MLNRLNLLLLQQHTTYLGYLLVGEANNNNNNNNNFSLTPRTRSEKLCAKEKTRLTTFWQDSPILEAGLIPVHAVLVTLFYSSRANAQSIIPTVKADLGGGPVILLQTLSNSLFSILFLLLTFKVLQPYQRLTSFFHPLLFNTLH